MSIARILTRNIFSNWVNLAVSIVIGFFMMPFLVYRLGDTMYGIWTLVVSLVGYGSLLDLGVRTSIVKYVSQFHATNDRDRLLCLFSTTLAVYTVIGVTVIILSAGAAFFLLHLFRIPAELVDEVRLVLLIVGINLSLKFPSGVFEGFLAGLQRYDVANAIAIGSNLFRTALTVALLLMGEKLLALAAVGLVSDLLMSLVMALVCLRLLPWLRFRQTYLDRSVLGEIYSYGLWSALIALASRVFYDSDSIFIGIFLPAAAITHFAVANNLVRYLRQMANGFGNVFNPAAANLEAKNEHERLGQLLIQGTRYSLAVILPGVILIALLGREFLSLWMGQRYATESGAILIVLVLSQVMGMAQFPGGAVLYGLNRHRYLAFIISGEALLKVILCLVLIPSHGILGSALGTAIPELVASLVVFPILMTRIIKVSLGSYLKESFFPPLVSALPAIALVLILKTFSPPTSWSSLVFEASATLLLYGAAAVWFCSDGPQRQSLRGALMSNFRRVVG